MKSTSFIATLGVFTASLCHAQTQKQKNAYPRFAAAMESYADLYQWEPVEFTTEDNYRLTSFMVTRVGDEQMPLPPIIVQHGNGWDAASWL